MVYRKTRKKRLARLALKLKRLHTPFVDRIAEVASGEREEAEILTLRWSDVKNLESLCPDLQGKFHGGMSVKIDQRHLIHLDNAGHLFGIAANSNHCDDLSPLHSLDFFSIPNIVRKPKKVRSIRSNTEFEQFRFDKRRFHASVTLILTLDTDYDCLYFVTMYRRSHAHSADATSPYRTR